MTRPVRTLFLGSTACCVLWAGALSLAVAPADREARLQEMQQEIGRLESELAALDVREAGVLGEIEKLGAELRLREAEFAEVTLRLENLNAQVEASTHKQAELLSGQEQRNEYLAARLRQLYRAGPRQALRGFIGGKDADDYWSGLRYASLLSERDARVLGDFYAAEASLKAEHVALAQKQAQLTAASAELEEARNRTARSRRKRSRILAGIRGDRERRRGALAELESAAERLTNLVDDLQPDDAAEALDVRKFKGLLGWPARGIVTAGFGTVIHPRFKTRVPHPGLDVDGPVGSDIASVFEGDVVFASWMRGYGLTAIVDHGGGLLSIYAHASVLLVEPGERVATGQVLGKIGDTGSLRGPYLYFELRLDGKAIEPIAWLSPRR